MDLFVWDHQFATGMPALDDQHRGLVALFNELHRALFDVELPPDRRARVLRRAVDRLMTYARVQFASEEAMMQRAGLDERHALVHRRQHEQFIHNLRDIWAQRDSLPDLPSRMMGFLASWIGLHVLGTDPDMVRQVVLLQAGVPAEQACDEQTRTHGADQAMRAMLNMVGVLFQDLSAQTLALGDALQGQAHAEQQQRLLGQQLAAQSRHDELLQVASQHHFEQRLDEEVARAFRREEAVAVMLLEVDQFASGIQPLGMATADECLQAVAQCLTDAMKRAADLVARHGQHGLAVLMPETDRHGASQAARRVVGRVRALGWRHPVSGSGVTVSVGVASWVPRSQTDGHLLLSEAQAAQYMADVQGGNRVCVA